MMANALDAMRRELVNTERFIAPVAPKSLASANPLNSAF